MAWSKEQRRAYERARYARMQDSEYIRISANTDRYRERNRKYIDEYKKDRPCVDCGQVFHPWAMDFDHLRDKLFNIGDIVRRGSSLKVLQDEMDKCELVCSNCHRVRTWERYQK